MKFEEYLVQLEQDAEYKEAEQERKPYLDLANKVLALRLDRGWSQAELARRAGTKQANISRIESAQANPTLKLLRKLADAFEVELAVYFGAQPEDLQSVPKTHLKGSMVINTVRVSGPRPWKSEPLTWPRRATGRGRWPSDFDERVELVTTDLDDPQRFTAA